MALSINMPKEKCNKCGNSNTKFKFFNNKKNDQPRYQCLDCSAVKPKPYFFNPRPKREHVHDGGYAKSEKVETEELKKLEKVCDKCGAVNDAKFRGYNNGNENQPRYACKACKKLFSPLKKSKAESRVVVAMEAAEPSSSNQYEQKQPATSEGSHQQIPPLQQQILPRLQPAHFQNPVQNTYSGATLQQFAFANQQPYFQAQTGCYYPPNPIPPPQQQTSFGVPLSNFEPPFQNNYASTQQPQQIGPGIHTAIPQQQQHQQQYVPCFQQQPYQQPHVHDNQYNPIDFQQQHEIQQTSFHNNLRHLRTVSQQQQSVPRMQQQLQQQQNYYNRQRTQQVPPGLHQSHHQAAFQINNFINQQTYVMRSVNQPPPPIEPASQSDNTDADSLEVLGILNEQDSPTTASLSENWSKTASPLPQQSSEPCNKVQDIPEEVNNMYKEKYFKDMMND